MRNLRTSVVMLALMTLSDGRRLSARRDGRRPGRLPATRPTAACRHAGRQAVGSALIGQPFSEAGILLGASVGDRPVPYNAAASGGSNLGPRNPDLAKNVRSRIDDLAEGRPGCRAVPVDLVTASGSGLDPHISPAAAEIQVRRVAVARNMTEEDVRELVQAHTEGRQFGILGEPGSMSSS